MKTRPSKARREPLDENVVALGKASFLHDVSSEMIFPFLPAFLTSVLGAPPLLLGMIEGAADSASSLLRPLFGELSDRFRRRKPFVVLGYAIANATRPLLAIVTAPWQVLAIRLCDRLGKGIRTAPRDALLADSAGPATRGRAFGFHRAMDHAGAVVGPVLGAAAFLAAGRSYRGLFLLASLPGLAVVLQVAFGTREPRRRSAPVSDGDLRPASSANALPRRFWMVAAAIFLFTLGNSSDAFLLLRLQQAGIDVALLPFLWSGLHVMKSVSVYWFGMLSDRVGRRPLLLAGWGLYTAIYVGFAIASSPLAVAAIFLFYGLFYGMTEGAERALIGDLVEPAERGLAFGIYNGAIGIAALPASVVMGAMWQAYGFESAFLLGAALALVATTVLVAGVSVPVTNDSRT